MGKAKIISGGTDGLYTIEIDAGAQQQASRVEAINQESTALAERIAQAETDYLATSTAETHAAGALNVAIENYVAAVAKNPKTASTADVDRLTADYYTAARFAGEARARLQGLLLQQRQLESDKATLANAPASETRQAWCVDLTEDAAGDVATIEVPGEPGTVLVAPGGRAPSASDGTLLARELMTPEQAFFNAAILPGWQKWMPTFRTGTITAVNSDNDTADVSLDDASSSAQGLGVNQTSSLSDVPVEYMECNAAAFEVGDPCVVRFDGQSWGAPRVVGFAREPKKCGWYCVNAVHGSLYFYQSTAEACIKTWELHPSLIGQYRKNNGSWQTMSKSVSSDKIIFVRAFDSKGYWLWPSMCLYKDAPIRYVSASNPPNLATSPILGYISVEPFTMDADGGNLDTENGAHTYEFRMMSGDEVVFYTKVRGFDKDISINEVHMTSSPIRMLPDSLQGNYPEFGYHNDIHRFPKN